jgi:hypothetical protein
MCVYIYTYTYVYTFFIILQPSDSGFVFYNSNRLLSVALHLSWCLFSFRMYAYIVIYIYTYIHVCVHASDFVRCSLATFYSTLSFHVCFWGYHLGSSIPIRSQHKKWDDAICMIPIEYITRISYFMILYYGIMVLVYNNPIDISYQQDYNTLQYNNDGLFLTIIQSVQLSVLFETTIRRTAPSFQRMWSIAWFSRVWTSLVHPEHPGHFTRRPAFAHGELAVTVVRAAELLMVAPCFLPFLSIRAFFFLLQVKNSIDASRRLDIKASVVQDRL